MLIKRKKLASIKGESTLVGTLLPGEIKQATQLEIHKARQEARAIKEEAQKILTESQNKFKSAELKANEIIQSAKS